LTMNIIYLSHRIPYPPNKGDKIRSFNQIKYLAASGHDIHLVCLADQKHDLDYQSVLLRWCKSVYVEYLSPKKAKIRSLPWLLSSLPLSVPYFYRRSLQKHVDRLLEQEDIKTVFCFSSAMGEYVRRSKAPDMQKKLLVLDYCDLDSDKWRQYSKSTSWPMSWIYAREASTLLMYEQKANEIFDHSIFISRAEADLFSPFAPEPERISVMPNGVDHQFFSSPPKAGLSDPPVLVFTGAMDYQANVDGVVWFCKTALPELQKRFPGLKMYMVGSNPSPAVKSLAAEDIVVTGYVQDIRQYYSMADVCVVPLRLARGVQNKVLEAMAMSRPVVTTSRVLQGINASPDRDLLLADDEHGFVDQLTRVLSDERLSRDLSDAGRNFVLKNYDWQTNLQAMDKMLESRTAGERRPMLVSSCLNPLFFPVYILLMFLAILWPMEETSPGASLTYRINPDLQNFLHLPVFAGFSLLFFDFIRNFFLSPALRMVLFLFLGLGLCVLLEWLQLFVPGRYFSLSDILVNISGLFLGLALHAFWCSGLIHRHRH